MRIRRWAALAAAPLLLSTLPAAEAAAPTIRVDRAPVVISGAATGITAAVDVDTDPSGRIYVLTPDAVRVFAPGARGNATPVRSVSLGFAATRSAARLAVDEAGWIYVISRDGGVDPEVTVVRPAAATPPVTYAAGDLGLGTPLDLTAVGSQVAIVDNDSNAVEFYDLRSGDTVRERYLAAGSDTATQIFEPQAIDADPAGRIVLSGRNWVSVFAAGADSTNTPGLAPQRYLAGSRTGLGSDADRYTTGVGLDRRGAIVVGTTEFYVLPDTLEPRFRNQRILAFAPGATGNATPTAVLAGTRSGLGDLSGLDLGPTGSLVTNRADMATQAYTAAVSVHRPLGPYTAPARVTGLKVSGGKKAARRTVSWRPAVANSDVPVRSYAVRVTCAGSVKLARTIPAGRRAATVALGRTKRATCTVKVTASNAIGVGPVASTTFRVKR
ncbi:hypothetical protein ABFT23_16135 [Nocardioides sp. C4-1]|uniref:hypothetical protein n=1 Tax=Nocardioides sp. C4-1 TaxID=3151851 RepID=UPI0032630D25